MQLLRRSTFPSRSPCSTRVGARLPCRRLTCSRPTRRLLPPAAFLGALFNVRLKPASLSSIDEDVSYPQDRDEFKESSRQFFRAVFDHDRWAAHRSTSRYARHMLGMPQSRIVRGLSQPILYVVGISAAVCLYESALLAGVLPEGFPSVELQSREPFQLTSFALSLLLVFRTNASYSRWLDARKTWGLVVNRSRDIVRQGLAYIPAHKAALRGMLCRWVPAFSRVLMCHVREGADVERELQGVLLPHEVEAVLQAEHRPSFVLQVLSEIVQDATAPSGSSSIPSQYFASTYTSNTSSGSNGSSNGSSSSLAEAAAVAAVAASAAACSPAALRMDENLTALEDCLGTCERILRTPIPLSYTRHTSRFLIIWLTLLPSTLFSQCGWASVPLCAIIAFLLLGIEEIGVSIEEPFSILALEFMCDTLQRNVAELQAVASGAGGQGSNGTGRPGVSAAQLVAIAKAQAAGLEEVAAAGHGGALGPAAAAAGAAGANGNGKSLA